MAIKCDICDGEIIVNQNREAVCSNCGMKYSIEALRSKVGNSKQTKEVEPERKNPVNNSGAVNLAKLHLQNNRKREADAIAEQILAEDYSNSNAWEIKVLANESLGNIINIFVSYYNECGTTKTKERAIRFGQEYFDSIALPVGIDSIIKDVVGNAVSLLSVSPNMANSLVERLLKKRLEVYDNSISELKERFREEEYSRPRGKETGNLTMEHSRYLINRLLDRCTADCNNFNYILTFSKAEGSDIYDEIKCFTASLLSIFTTLRSFKYWTVSHYYSSENTFEFVSLVEPDDYYDRTMKKCSSQITSLSRDMEAHQAQKKAAYWKAHPEERAALENEVKELSQKLGELEEKIYTLPSYLKMESFKKTVKKKKEKLENLSFFSFIKKKRLKAEIEKDEKTLKRLVDNWEKESELDREEYYKIDQEITDIKNELF